MLSKLEFLDRRLYPSTASKPDGTYESTSLSHLFSLPLAFHGANTMASISLPAAIPENWNEGNISKPWSQFIDYIVPTRMPIDEDPFFKSTPRWTAVLQPEPTLAPRFARLESSLPDRLLGALQGLLANPGTYSFTGAPLWVSDIPDTLATCLDHLPREIGVASRGFSGMAVTVDVRGSISRAAFVAVRDLADSYHQRLDKVTFTSSHQPNSWRNDWSVMCGDRAVLVGQDYHHEVIRDMPGLQSGLVLQSSSTHEGLPAILVQVCICLSLAYSVINDLTSRSATACSPGMLDSRYSSARPFFASWRLVRPLITILSPSYILSRLPLATWSHCVGISSILGLI